MDPQAELDKRKAPMTADDVAGIRQRLSAHQDRIDAQAEVREFVEDDLCRRITDAFGAVLDTIDDLDDDQRATVRAAIEYFLDPDDAEDDVYSPIGLEDDAFIANHAFELIGREDLTVSVI